MTRSTTTWKDTAGGRKDRQAGDDAARAATPQVRIAGALLAQSDASYKVQVDTAEGAPVDPPITLYVSTKPRYTSAVRIDRTTGRFAANIQRWMARRNRLIS